jgi:uncharacterized membrane protein YphA (DoxX/SURF4 family)
VPPGDESSAVRALARRKSRARGGPPRIRLSAGAIERLGIAVRLAAAAVWLVAGAAKLPRIEAFREAVERYDLLPAAVAAPFAYALPFLEIGLGLYLAVGLFVRGAAGVGTLLFAAFLVAQGQAWVRGLVIDCGCFGTGVASSVGIGTMLRDLALGVPTFAMLAFPARGLSLDRRLFGAEDRFGSLFGRAVPSPGRREVLDKNSSL